jgi:hypothetical protein
MTYLPEKTIRYKTYIKTALVEALRPVFSEHIDTKLQSTKVSIDMPKDRQSFPAAIIKFYEKEIINAGVGHEERIDNFQVQTVTLHNASSGTFTLTLNNETTDPINYNAAASAIQSSLINLPSIGSDQVSVTGNAGGPYVVTFNSSLINSLSLMIANKSLLSGSNNNPPFVTVTNKIGKFKHYFYKGDIEIMIYALSSLDRDLIADTIVQTISMGDLSTYTNSFFNRIYPSDSDVYPDSIGHFININTDKILGFGETTTGVPWESEDELIYNTSYRVEVFGEFYSLPPEFSYEYVSQVFLYPYIGGLDSVPSGLSNGTTWV